MAGQRTKLLWANDGQQVLTGLVDGSRVYFENVPNNKKTNGFVGSTAAAWHRIELEGADTLDIEYQSEILDKGGLGTGIILGTTVRPTMVGLGYEDIIPSIIGAGPAAAEGDVILQHLDLMVRPREHISARLTHPDDQDPVMLSVGLLYIGTTPANGDKTFWGLEVGRRVYDEAIPMANPNDPTPAVTNIPFWVTGLSVVYVAVSTVTDFDAGDTMATTKLKATLRATLGYVGGSARFQRHISGR